MANSLDYQVTLDGCRNAIVKLTGYLDTSNISEVPAVPLSYFINNDANQKLIGFRVDLIEWSVSTPMEVNLAWQSINPQQIYLLSGRGRIGTAAFGGFLPDTTRPEYTGAINLMTANYQPGSVANFTVVLELIKLYK